MNPDCWTPACLLRQQGEAIAAAAAEPVTEAVLAGLAEPMSVALEHIFLLLVSWLLLPAVDLLGQCAPWADSGGGCAGSPSLQLRQWMLPVTAMVLLGGLAWQATVTAVTRKGMPLLQAGKGLVTAAAWGAVGIAGTQLALHAGDQYSCWIIARSVDSGAGACDPGGMANQDLITNAAENLSMMLLLTGASGPFLTLLFGIVVLAVLVTQLVLLVFREAAIVILAGMLQLAAAGLVTRGSSGWFQKVTSWTLTLVAYKPIVATVYAVAFMMVGGSGEDTVLRRGIAAGDGDGQAATELRWMILGLAMLVLSLVALPAAQRFFAWPVGHSSGGNSGAMATAVMSAGYAASSLRSSSTVAEQVRATEQTFGGPPPAGAAPATTPPHPGGPTTDPTHGTGATPGGATTGGATAGGAATGGTTTGGATTGGAATGAATGGAATGEAATGAAAGGGTTAAAGAGAAGPVGAAAAAVVHGGQQAAATAKGYATSATETAGPQ